MLHQKQTFLRQKVLDSGLDPQSFMHLMGTQKSQGQNINLNNWTMQQLQNIVNKFTQKQKYQEQPDHLNRASIIVADRVMGSHLAKQNKQSKVKYGRDDLFDFEIKYMEPCKNVNQFFQFQSEPEVKCAGVEVKKMGGFLGFGAKCYIEVSISNNFSSNSIIKRISQDADWLRQVLQSQYPGLYIPPLQPTPVFESQNKTIVSNHAKQIISFLNSLLHYPDLINNRFTHAFLTTVDSKIFENFKNKNTPLPKLMEIKQIQNLQGCTSIEISQRICNLVECSSKYSKQVIEIQNNIVKYSEKLKISLYEVTKYSQKLQSYFKKLKQKYAAMSLSCNIANISSFPTQFNTNYLTLLTTLQKLFLTTKQSSKTHTNTIKTITQQLPKYHIKQWQQFNKFYDHYIKQRNQYLDYKLNFGKKKQTFITTLIQNQLKQKQQKGNIKETTITQRQNLFKTTCKEEKQIYDKKKKWLAFLNHMFEKSFMMLLNEQEKQISKKMIEVCQQLLKFDTKKIIIYSEFLDKTNHIKQ